MSSPKPPFGAPTDTSVYLHVSPMEYHPVLTLLQQLTLQLSIIPTHS